MPDHDLALELLNDVGPMAVSSANVTGWPGPTMVDAATQLGAAVFVYLDGGETTGGLASTILDCTTDEPVILREGALSASSSSRSSPRTSTLLRTRLSSPTPTHHRPTARPPTATPKGPPPMSDTFYGSDYAALQAFDPDIAEVLVAELDRLRGGLQLIASENFSSPEVLTALGSTLSNKYAEGYPGRRYYGGCVEVDKAEELAIERCKALFGADHANVQPHSGASANQAVYGAFMSRVTRSSR